MNSKRFRAQLSTQCRNGKVRFCIELGVAPPISLQLFKLFRCGLMSTSFGASSIGNPVEKEVVEQQRQFVVVVLEQLVERILVVVVEHILAVEHNLAVLVEHRMEHFVVVDLEVVGIAVVALF